MGARADVATKHKDGLSDLSSAPLKPQQRMYCLNHHLIPVFYHQLTLAPCTDKYLGWIDKSIRSAIRSWLKLPKDTPTALFHAEIVNGGLGVPLFSQTIPLLKQKRIANLCRSEDPVIQAILVMPQRSASLLKQGTSRSFCGTVVSSKQCLRSALARSLHESVDGCGLALASQVPQQHQWLEKPDSALTGADFIGAIKVRGNLMNVPLRAARGRVDASTTCDACGRVGSLGHFLQSCPRTRASRVARHNRVVELVAFNARKKGWDLPDSLQSH